eukprot:CAMPEP_0197011632 /NCGR_PEP_ID=MMETSP1380-20130617/59349_1 /TAXON_ID=5936 /ORGANISM="Euplotes crassus, Strain CT5" /LENGTH=144 /DNA_ID=CAMNT_0042434501 /DNA_START=60 /DNA_END=494 /DNA_ORIENTATION=+
MPEMCFSGVSEIDPNDFKLFEDFPSICDLDPTEAVEKKCCRIDPFHKLFENPSIHYREEEVQYREEFSFTTEELLEDLERDVMGEHVESEKCIEEAKTQGDEALEDSQNLNRAASQTEKIKSFENRKRFSKKHDREMFLVLNKL